MNVLKKDGTTEKFDVSKISTFSDWKNNPNSKIPNILEKIDDSEDISERVIIESIQQEKNF